MYILSIIFVKERFQYLKHSLQKRMVYHSNQLLHETIIKLWQRGYSNTQRFLTPLMTLPLLKSPKAQLPTKSRSFRKQILLKPVKKSGRPRSVRTPQLQNSTRAKIVRNQKRSQRNLLASIIT